MAFSCFNAFMNLSHTLNTESVLTVTQCVLMDTESTLIYLPFLIWLILTKYTMVDNSSNSSSSSAKTLSSSRLQLLTTFLTTILLTISLNDTIDAIDRHYLQQQQLISMNNFVLLLTYLVKTLTYIYLILVQNSNNNNFAKNNITIIRLFWISLFIQTIYNVSISQVIKNLHFILIGSQLLLSLFTGPTRPITNDDDDDDNINKDIETKVCPKYRASLWSKLTYGWFTPMIMKGYRRDLTIDDMWSLDRSRQSAVAVKRLEQHWRSSTTTTAADDDHHYNHNHRSHPRKSQTREKTANFFVAILRTFWPQLAANALLSLAITLFGFSDTLLLDRFITFMTPNNPEPLVNGFIYALLMFMAPVVETIVEKQYYHWSSAIQMNIMSALKSIIFQKSLRLSSTGRRDYSSAEIINLISNDVWRVESFIYQIISTLTSVVQFSLSLWILWGRLGVASLAGLTFSVLLVPVNWWLSRDDNRLWELGYECRTKRIKKLNELITNIRFLKVNAWEPAFRDQVFRLRKQEMDANISANRRSNWRSLYYSISYFMENAITFFAFIYISDDNILDPNKVFVSLSLMGKLKIGFITSSINSTREFLIYYRKLKKYFDANEINDQSIGHDIIDDKIAISMKNVSFSWDPISTTTTTTTTTNKTILRNLTLSLRSGSLVAVVGQVGSGKSSLLSALLGEMDKSMDGLVNVSGRTAYVSQEPWIQNTTIKQNILFTKRFNKLYYNKVVDSCALRPDLQILGAGDLTEIGEKGINLSGGQKQRVSLARAVYSDADIYLLDDPLSAVDAHVGRHLFDHIIGPKGLLRHKTRVLVTHKASILPEVDQIVVMKNGAISELGTFDDLMSRDGDFAQFIAEFVMNEVIPTEDNGTDIIDENKESEMLSKLRASAKPIIERQESVMSNDSSGGGGGSGCFVRQRSTAAAATISRSQSLVSDSVITDDADDDNSDDDTDYSESDGKLIADEKLETGSVKWSVYRRYFQMLKLDYLSLCIVSYLIAYSARIGSDLWLSNWSNDALDAERAADKQLRNRRLTVYTALGFADPLFMMFAEILVLKVCFNVGLEIHNQMVERMIMAPMSYFDTTPVGRILDRFSKDMNTIDNAMFYHLWFTLMRLFSLLKYLSILSIETPLILLAIGPVAIVYTYAQRIYIAALRQLKRLKSSASSPITSYFVESYNGTSTLRAYGATDYSLGESYRRMDTNNSMSDISESARYWIDIRVNALSATIVFLVSTMSVLLRGSVAPGLTALAIQSAQYITNVFHYFLRGLTDTETDMVTFEKCLEFTNSPIEADWSTGSVQVPNDWPQKGCIRFENYSTRYRDGLDLVLKDLSFEIRGGEKVAIVGRTGAGKSSLVSALFRVIEPISGTFYIDGIDCTQIGLHELRSRLTVISQDSYLFSGSLRYNLDPLDQYSDDELWSALESTHLRTFVQSLESGLKHEIAENGENLSAGQKQLICLARAVLRRTKIVVLDEATASIDMETDDWIQRTLRSEFKWSTIVTIAHRLNTIIDYDRVFVMDGGVVVESGHPMKLLNRTDSRFYSMAKQQNLIKK